MSTEKKRQHYLPQFYLRGFGDPQHTGMVWLHIPNQKPRLRPISKTAAHDWFYAYHNPDGTQNNEVEDRLGKIENDSAKVLREHLFPGSKVTGHVRKHLAVFTATLALRTPWLKQTNDDLLLKYASAILQRRHPGDPEIQKAIDAATSGDIKVNWENRFHMESMLDYLPSLTFCFMEKKWCFFHAGQRTFITSDRAFARDLPGKRLPEGMGQGFALPGLRIFFPLSSEVLLVMSDRLDHLEGHKYASGVEVMEANFLVAEQASLFVISNSAGTRLPKAYCNFLPLIVQ